MAIFFLLVIGIAMTLMLHFTHLTALATEVQKTNPAPAAQPNVSNIQQQIAGLMTQIRLMEQDLEQAKKERQQLQQQLQALKQAKPVPPPGNDAAAKAEYQRNLNDWQAKISDVQNKISKKDMEIKQKEAELAKLRQKLQSLQGGSRPVRR